jgi:hypothetical protein
MRGSKSGFLGKRMNMFRPRPRRDKPKIMFFVTEDWYFLSYRLCLARALKANDANPSSARIEGPDH